MLGEQDDIFGGQHVSMEWILNYIGYDYDSCNSVRGWALQ